MPIKDPQGAITYNMHTNKSSHEYIDTQQHVKKLIIMLNTKAEQLLY